MKDRDPVLPLPSGEGWGEGKTHRNPPAYPDTLAHSRALRRRPTDAEKALWRELRGRRLMGARFRRQQPIGPFIVDYYCASARLVVEIDGGGHALEKNPERDRERDRALAREGIRVLRFWNTDVLQNLEGVLRTILEAVASPSPRPSPGGRGGK